MATMFSTSSKNPHPYKPLRGMSDESKTILTHAAQSHAHVISVSISNRQSSIIKPSSNETLRETLDEIMNIPHKFHKEVNPITIHYAIEWIMVLFGQIIYNSCEWISPLVTFNGFGQVVFEWWVVDKKLSVYLESNTAQYIKMWTESNELCMIDDEVLTKNMPNKQLWLWLVG